MAKKDPFKKPLNPIEQTIADNKVATEAAKLPVSTGAYNPNTKSYNTPTSSYPTKNPDFVPKPEGSTTEITVNADGSFGYKAVGGAKETLSREEMKALNDDGGGFVTPKTERIQQLQNPQQQNPEIQTLSQDQIQTEAGYNTDLRKNELVGNTLQVGAQILDKVSSFLPSSLKFGTSKSIDVIKAEQGFADYSSAIDNQISLYQAGKLPLSTLQRSFDVATQSIIELQKQTKGQGQIDLRFWLDQGKEIEAQVVREISALENKKLSLGL